MSSILKDLRENNSLTQDDVVKRTGIPYNTYRRYEYGDTFPKNTAIIALARLYNYPTPGALFDELVDTHEAATTFC